MRKFRDGATITVEPFRVGSFPLLERSGSRSQRAGPHCASRRIHFCARRLSAGGELDSDSESTTLIWQWKRPLASDAAHAPRPVQMDRPCFSPLPKVSHLSLLPQGHPERESRVLRMVSVMDAEGFGNCTNTYECEAVCPAEISASFIAKLNREYARAAVQRGAGE